MTAKVLKSFLSVLTKQPINKLQYNYREENIQNGGVLDVQQAMATEMESDGQIPILILGEEVKRESGDNVRLNNINSAAVRFTSTSNYCKAIADVIRTCLGPRAMLKMVIDGMGGIAITSDGNAVLRELQVQDAAAKAMIEVSRTQDQETGDGTTSVIILASEFMRAVKPFLEQGFHPIKIITTLQSILDDIVVALKDQLSCLGTKLMEKYIPMATKMAMEATKIVMETSGGNRKEIDIKRFVRIEKIPGGSLSDSELLKGVVLNKDVLHPKMRRYIKNPRIILLDGALEFKKAESKMSMNAINVEEILHLEELALREMCDAIIALKPDLVFTEKGCSDLVLEYLMRSNISVIRRIKKTDNDRLSRVCGAQIVSEVFDLNESDVGTKATLFEVELIGHEYFAKVVNHNDPHACTLILRGANKDLLKEIERNFNDALNVVRNVYLNPRAVPGGGAVEMCLGHILKKKAFDKEGVAQFIYNAIADAFEVIPLTLLSNCDSNPIREITSLRVKYAQEISTWGVNGINGSLVDMHTYNVWDPLLVKQQIYKSAIETTMMILRIDDIVSGVKSKRDNSAGQVQ
ncbi:T-complex protein 1, gamma subunit [Trichinella nativa]|uniref:T-complex protein 1 subunit gamma n=1 Tax=Trichinella nativa TaxID=6335 RepID=A0A1Y3ES63_9BILA|nr:T-complex protein 1, gamma subunit [Trichinella nativa]